LRKKRRNRKAEKKTKTICKSNCLLKIKATKDCEWGIEREEKKQMDYSNVCRSGEGNRKEGEDMVRN
jgi:hypothetical protein